MIATATNTDRLLRGGALAAMLTLAVALLVLGLYFYRPTLAAAEPAPRLDANAELNLLNTNTDLPVQKEMP